MKLAIISDIHANYIALKEVLIDIDKNDCEKILVLGDLVGYYYWPKEVVSLIKDNPRFIVIKGNHENLLNRCLNDSKFSTKCYEKYGSSFEYCKSELSELEIAWLSALPESLEIKIDDLLIGLYHGSERDLNEYIYPDVPMKRLNKIKSKCDFLFFGHTHYPTMISNKGITIVNPGSVGQPRDIGSLASYAILNTENRSVSFKRVIFDSAHIQLKSKMVDPHYPYLHEIFLRNNIYAKNNK